MSLHVSGISPPGQDIPESWHLVLSIERRVWRSVADKDAAIVEAGLQPWRYYQILNTLINDRRVLTLEPRVVRRIRCSRDTLRRRRGLMNDSTAAAPVTRLRKAGLARSGTAGLPLSA